MEQNIIGFLNPLLAVIFSVAFFSLWFIQKNNRYILLLSAGYLSFACGMLVSNIATEANESLHVLGTHIFYSIASILLALAVCLRAGQPTYLWLNVLLAIGIAPILLWIHEVSPLLNIRVILANAIYSLIFFTGVLGLWKNRHNHRSDYWLFVAFLFSALQFMLRPSAILALEGNLPNKDYLNSIYYSTLNVTLAILSLLLALSLIAVCTLDYMGEASKRKARAGTRKADASNEDKILKLQQVMQTGIHKQHDLSISMLAEIMKTQEHQLSVLINQTMGYKNFREFLNSYRLKQAREALSDPALDSAPITTIAFDSGFNSIPSFNRVFKLEFGIAPSTYRDQQIAKRDLHRAD